MSDASPVRFAIIGCGSIASSGYQPRMLAYPKKVAIHGYFSHSINPPLRVSR